MKIVDLSHLMNVHTPGWVGYAGNKMYYAQNLQTIHIVAQRIDSALHVGTHIDGAMHGTDGIGDMASYPVDFLVGPGVVVEGSPHMDDWALSTPVGRASPSKTWCAISACIPAERSNCSNGCSKRRSNGSASIAAPAIIR